MNKELIKYSEMHINLLKIKNKLKNNENKKNAIASKDNYSKYNNKKKTIELETEKVTIDLKKYLKIKDKGINHIKELNTNELSNSSPEQLKEFKAKVNKASLDLRKLEEKLEHYSLILKNNLTEHEALKVNLEKEKSNYTKFRDLYLKEEEEIKQKVKELNIKLEEQEENVEKDLLDLYKTVRSDILSPIVKESEGTCVGCGTIFSISAIESIKSNGYIKCENCTRIVFKND